jgi:capsular polysaccharide export protein
MISKTRYTRVGVLSEGIREIPFVEVLLGASVHALSRFRRPAVDAIAGWGVRPSSEKACRLAAARGLPYLALEDGFLRSRGTGDQYPPLSMVVDTQGIYYDSTRESSLEQLLQSDADVLQAHLADVQRARAMIVAQRLSKYNHAPLLAAGQLRDADHQRVLVVDQTAGDMSVALGGANADTFSRMLAAARTENPRATIYVKTHPEVASGRKGGYLTHVQDDETTVVLRAAINPLSLIGQMDRVYVVSSTMGFEALLAARPVTCFGLPWYAGWGETDDRQHCPRRTRRRSTDELFAAAYFHYSNYLDPYTHERGDIFAVIDWLTAQRQALDRFPQRWVAVGMQRWKQGQLRPMLSMATDGAAFVGDSGQAERLALSPRDGLIHWGRDEPAGLDRLARTSGARLYHLEDGFYRSVGLGSDLIMPRSVVIDGEGLYFDPRGISDLEQILNHADFSAAELTRAQRLRQLILQQGLTKYNLAPPVAVGWPTGGRAVVLVPGQVEDDASIRHGCEGLRTNLALLQAAREASPQAFVVYKPHPDVLSGNRKGAVALQRALAFADHIETEASMIACIDACDRMFTLTSMAGFEALLREKSVVVYGRPFYAGWGLTEDALTLQRRARSLRLDELVAGTLLRYPLYWDPELRGFTRCESVLMQLARERDALAGRGELARLSRGWLPRLLRQGRAWLEYGWR